MIQTTIRIPEKLYEKIKRCAKEKGMSVNSFILVILWDKEGDERK